MARHPVYTLTGRKTTTFGKNVKCKDDEQTMGITCPARARETEQDYPKLANRFQPDVSKNSLGKEKISEDRRGVCGVERPRRAPVLRPARQAPMGEDFSPPPG
jgi:curved DNA-binding protein